MNPLGLLALFWLIARYLRESGDPSCERAGERLERDLSETWDCTGQASGYLWAGCLALMILFVLLPALGRGCGLLLGRP